MWFDCCSGVLWRILFYPFHLLRFAHFSGRVLVGWVFCVFDFVLPSFWRELEYELQTMPFAVGLLWAMTTLLERGVEASELSPISFKSLPR